MRSPVFDYAGYPKPPLSGDDILILIEFHRGYILKSGNACGAT
jgi:hypothetical protein